LVSTRILKARWFALSACPKWDDYTMASVISTSEKGGEIVININNTQYLGVWRHQELEGVQSRYIVAGYWDSNSTPSIWELDYEVLRTTRDGYVYVAIER